MAGTEDTDPPYKRIWNDDSTKLLISVFKEYYELWRNGTIEKKNQMWLKIAAELNKKGLDCTAGQAENRFKTLIRSYRKACGIIPGRNGRRYHHPFTEDLTDVFIENMGLTNNSIDDEDEDAIIIDASNQDIEENDGVQQFLDESTGSIFTLSPQIMPLASQNRPMKKDIKTIFRIMQTSDESNDAFMENNDSKITGTKLKPKGNIGARIDKIINSNEQILSRASSSQNRRTITRRKPVSIASKTNVDVLLEMKELLKKIEIRRQARHEQNIKIAKERNAILRRKNEILEKLLAKLD